MPKLSLWVRVPLGVLAVVGLGLVLAAGQVLYRYHWRLPRERLTTTATVDSWKISPSGRYTGPTYDVRYHFSPLGSSDVYGPEGKFLFLESKNPWVPIDQDVWEASRESGVIEVEYSTEEPALNHPVAGRSSMGDVLAGLLIGLILMALGALMLWPLKRRRTTPTLPEPP